MVPIFDVLAFAFMTWSVGYAVGHYFGYARGRAEAEAEADAELDDIRMRLKALSARIGNVMREVG